ncbi:hypothetical protein BJ917_5835 [Pseudomonas sp. WPR_5_2]|nr:hypothetical protein BJ917_5835 [Pseudomonas sp. WPR_5_2]
MNTLNPCRSEPARDKPENTAGYQVSPSVVALTPNARTPLSQLTIIIITHNLSLDVQDGQAFLASH